MEESGVILYLDVAMDDAVGVTEGEGAAKMEKKEIG